MAPNRSCIRHGCCDCCRHLSIPNLTWCLCNGYDIVHFLRIPFVYTTSSTDCTSTHLEPLISGEDVDKKLDTLGRRTCTWVDRFLPLIAVAALEGNVEMLQNLANKGKSYKFGSLIVSVKGKSVIFLSSFRILVVFFRCKSGFRRRKNSSEPSAHGLFYRSACSCYLVSAGARSHLVHFLSSAVSFLLLFMCPLSCLLVRHCLLEQF